MAVQTAIKIDPHVYTPPTSYRPTSEYFQHVLPLLPKLWRLRQENFWTSALLPDALDVVQGWKIHVSATRQSALRVLGKVVPICIKHGTHFKFASDDEILTQLLDKLCSRGSSGKFITIYPATQEKFKLLLEELYSVLEGERGPHILSDRQYRDSSVLHYRYGGFHGFPQPDVNGGDRMCILDDQYRYLEDVRSARFRLPTFVDDVFDTEAQTEATPQKEQPQSPALFDDRYTISKSLQFTNAGGVYLGRDCVNDRPVVIKEARPYVAGDKRGVDAVARLEKEFRMLTKIADERIAATPYGMFQEWDHTFMAMEFVEGVTLRDFTAGSNKLVQAEPEAEAVAAWLEKVFAISLSLLKMFAILHRHNIIFGDISLNNLIINEDSLELRLIDFEAAYEPGVDAITNLFTPGYGTWERMRRECIDFQDDHYALGCLLLALLAPNVTLIQAREDFVDMFFAEVRKDLVLPEGFSRCVEHLLTAEKVSYDWCIEQILSCQAVGAGKRSRVLESSTDFCARVLGDIYAYNRSVFDPAQRERPLPGGPKLVDPLAVDHGMLGVAYAWHKINGNIPPEFDHWIRREFHPARQRPGLWNGLSGIAWVLLELGQEDNAVRAVQAAALHPLLFQKYSLGYGAAGYGLTCLFFWKRTGKKAYLDKALHIADILCEQARETPNGCTWEDPLADSGVSIGLHEGASGIALFLLYAHCASGEARYLDMGERGLAFDAAHGHLIDGATGFPRRSTEGSSILYPYLGYGSAGIGTVALRFYAVTGKQVYRDLVDKLKTAVAQKYTVSAELFIGLAGLGNYMLDAYQFLGDEQYLQLAHRTAHGIKLFELPRDVGSTFLCLEQAKLNVDYAAGSAGIAMFLHRLSHGTGNDHFLMDELLGNKAVHGAVAALPAQKVKEGKHEHSDYA